VDNCGRQRTSLDVRLGSESNQLSKCLPVNHFAVGSNCGYPVRYPANKPDCSGSPGTRNGERRSLV
jgi:hypothetical protein